MSETWEPVSGLPWSFSGYEASDDSVWITGRDGRVVQVTGGVRSVDRTLPSGRPAKGVLLKVRPSNKGYLLVNMTGDDGKAHTFTVQKIILSTFAGAAKTGQQARHLDDNPLNNRWAAGDADTSRAAGGNLVWGNERDQYDDKLANGMAPPTAPPPSFPCRNAPRCASKVPRENRRCLDCVAEMGRDAAVLLYAGESLAEVARHFGCSANWAFQLAVKHGRYSESRVHAESQRRTRSQRVMTTVRGRWRRGDGK